MVLIFHRIKKVVLWCRLPRHMTAVETPVVKRIRNLNRFHETFWLHGKG